MDAAGGKPRRHLDTQKGSVPPFDSRDIVAKNVSSSTAGASSGDFHVYRQQRRAEMERVEKMEMAARLEKQTNRVLAKVEELKAREDFRTARRAAKRRRMKTRRGNAIAASAAAAVAVAEEKAAAASSKANHTTPSDSAGAAAVVDMADPATPSDSAGTAAGNVENKGTSVPQKERDE